MAQITISAVRKIKGAPTTAAGNPMNNQTNIIRVIDSVLIAHNRRANAIMAGIAKGSNVSQRSKRPARNDSMIKVKQVVVLHYTATWQKSLQESCLIQF